MIYVMSDIHGSNARVRRYMDLPCKGNSYRRVFDYWWTLY